MRRSVLEPWISAKTGCISRAELDRWQLERLRDILAYTKKRSAFYGCHLKGINPENITTREKLSHIPFTTPEQLRADPQSWLCRGQPEVERIVTLKTSGTTTTPKRVFFQQEDRERTIDFFAHGMEELVSPDDRVLILMPGRQPGSVGALLKEALSRVGVEAVLGGTVTDIAASHQTLNASNCNSIVGIPVQILGLAEYEGLLPPNRRAHLKSVLLSADATPPAMVSRIEKQMGCHVFTHFGMTEMGFGVAVECSAHNGCHIRENDILVEVVDPETGASLPDGNLGEFVFTTLDWRAMPFVRYRTGDMGMLLAQPCLCGSYIKRMLPWGGRLTDKGRLWDLDQHLLSCPDVVDYTIKDESLTLLGVIPPDVNKVRFQLAGHPNFDTLSIRSQSITGFTGTGMKKRTL